MYIVILFDMIIHIYHFSCSTLYTILLPYICHPIISLHHIITLFSMQGKHGKVNHDIRRSKHLAEQVCY